MRQSRGMRGWKGKSRRGRVRKKPEKNMNEGREKRGKERRDTKERKEEGWKQKGKKGKGKSEAKRLFSHKKVNAAESKTHINALPCPRGAKTAGIKCIYVVILEWREQVHL